MTTTVTEGNHVSIPPDIAREFDIHPGTRLEWAKAGEGTILVKPVPSRKRSYTEALAAIENSPLRFTKNWDEIKTETR